jgi:hypothetical protein
MLFLLKPLLDWVRSQHPMYVIFPYFVFTAFATFPSSIGLTSAALASCLFLLTFLGWRLNGRKD